MKCKDATIRDHTVPAPKRPARCGPPSGRGFSGSSRARPRSERDVNQRKGESPRRPAPRRVRGGGRGLPAWNTVPCGNDPFRGRGVKFPSILLVSRQEMHTTMIDAILRHRPLTAIDFAIILLTTRKHVGNTRIFLRLD